MTSRDTQFAFFENSPNHLENETRKWETENAI